ncbi:hypothetical protein [Endozoicomonas sp. ALE010]|uniref:hypothetical protein n=1 Tax=Endozoicomonas sp. ALE010 TaxID=3403081 RepID=UPI003BB4E158
MSPVGCYEIMGGTGLLSMMPARGATVMTFLKQRSDPDSFQSAYLTEKGHHQRGYRQGKIVINVNDRQKIEDKNLVL